MNFSIILLLCMFISPPYGTAFGNTGMALLRQSSKTFESSEDDLSGQYNEAFQNSKKTLFGLHNTSLENSEETFLGKYICTTGKSLGLTLYGDDMSGFSLELKNDG